MYCCEAGILEALSISIPFWLSFRSRPHRGMSCLTLYLALVIFLNPGFGNTWRFLPTPWLSSVISQPGSYAPVTTGWQHCPVHISKLCRCQLWCLLACLLAKLSPKSQNPASASRVGNTGSVLPWTNVIMCSWNLSRLWIYSCYSPPMCRVSSLNLLLDFLGGPLFLLLVCSPLCLVHVPLLTGSVSGPTWL